jgi:hypothetical protein
MFYHIPLHDAWDIFIGGKGQYQGERKITMHNNIADVLLMIGVGILIGAVTNVIAHFLAIVRDKMRQEWEEAQEEDCDDRPPKTANTES